MNSTCETFQAAISARADGEQAGIAPELIDAHLQHCATCADFAAEVEQLRRRTRIAAAPNTVDLSAKVSRAAAAADRAQSPFVARWLLAVVAVQIMVFSFSDLFATDVHADVAHAARHLGAFTLAYAVGLLVVVARPARARTMLNVAVVLSGALVITGVVDVTQGRAPLLGESAAHLPEVLSVVLLWILTRPRLNDARAAPLQPLRTPVRSGHDRRSARPRENQPPRAAP